MRLDWLQRLIQHGCLRIHLQQSGQTIRLGDGKPEAAITMRSRGVLNRILRNPDFALGDAYVEGDWWPEGQGLLPLFQLYFLNVPGGSAGNNGPGTRLLRRLHRLMIERNGRRRARRNVQAHYDLDADLFRRFLDPELHYSCAYFPRPGMTLEAAQQAKCEHIARKLCLRPGDRVLDIGSGWGGLACHLAETRHVHVDGLTLSDDQYRESCRRVAERGMTQRVQFFLRDYREHRGCYDAIVSVGMFEHVGRPQYPVFFDAVAGMLADSGRVLLHTIGRSGPPVDSDSWISRHVFPGGYIPALSEVAGPLERSGLVLSDLEVWRRHYALTLRAWHQRFQAVRGEFHERLGEPFCRTWEFYLQACEALFTWGELVVFQCQMADANDSVPIARDYLYQSDLPESRFSASA
ncbi:MAG: cyclopropane-fatty-acyl-phospholipid synthase family protein [Salinisphaeraceae bacterium]